MEEIKKMKTKSSSRRRTKPLKTGEFDIYGQSAARENAQSRLRFVNIEASQDLTEAEAAITLRTSCIIASACLI
ncbi:hypothetical protein SDJN03_24533, partial [Cucurbita argyrosperma subsp. sororia]